MNRDFVEMLSVLCDNGVEFLVVGAHALAVHSRPRATGDLDIWVRPSAGNASRVMKALRAFGAPLENVREDDFVTAGQVLQLGVVPNRIDLLSGISGVVFEEAWPRRREVRMEGLVVPVLGREDLIRNKAATGRPLDLADLALLRDGEDEGA